MYLPRGANFVRQKLLWEVGLHVAGDPGIRYGDDRDMRITVGSGSHTTFRPSLRMATGSPILAHAVANGARDAAGGLEMAMVNPSAMLTQAYRGVGLFTEPLPVRIVGVFPSWDKFVFMVDPAIGITSLHQVREERYPLKLSIREDVTHSTRGLVDQVLEVHGFSLDDLVSWGGELQLNGGPGDERRLRALRDGRIEAIFDEGIGVPLWFEDAVRQGMVPLSLDEEALSRLTVLGWRPSVVPADRYDYLESDYPCIDYSGWPLYTRASVDDDVVYRVCEALYARAEHIPWEGSFINVQQCGRETEATPMDVPLHPGAARWYEGAHHT
ncbi:TAXI family TRAP transporter solute-binding subunit [Pseudonocardia sichuanensis]